MSAFHEVAFVKRKFIDLLTLSATDLFLYLR